MKKDRWIPVETVRSVWTVRTAFTFAVVALLAACGGGEGASDGEPADGAGAESGAAGTEGQAGGTEPRRYDITSLGYDAGDLDAPVRVVEFSDFACPHCRAFHLDTYPTLHEEYVETGQVVWKYIPFASGAFPASVHAARAGECAIEQGGDAFPTLRDRIFLEQPNWVDLANPTPLLLEYAAEEGLDTDQLLSCIEQGRRDQNLQANIAIARDAGIPSTPSFIFGDVFLPGNQPIEVYRDVIEGIIAEESGGGSDGA